MSDSRRFASRLRTFSGAYVISNSPREAPMRKVVYGQTQFERLLETLNETIDERELVERLRRLGCDSTPHHPDAQIAKQTGRDEAYNQPLSAIFVRFPAAVRYGTRCQTIVLVDADDRVFWREERMITAPEDPADAKWDVVEHRFELEQP